MARGLLSRARAVLGSLLVLYAGCVGEITTDHVGPPGTTPRPDAGWSSDAGATPPPPPGVDAGRPDAGSTDAGSGAPPPPIDAGAPSTGDLTPAELDLLGALNDERTRLGLGTVEPDPRLMCAARKHALDVGGSGACGHVGSDGTWPWDRAMACGFPQDTWTVNEIAAGPGFTDGADAVWGWSQSPGHYAALTHTRARTVGVAVHNTCFIALFDCCVAGSE